MTNSKCLNCGAEMGDDLGKYCPMCGEKAGLSFMTPEETQVEFVYQGERMRLPDPHEIDKKNALHRLPHMVYYDGGRRIAGRMFLHNHGVAFDPNRKVDLKKGYRDPFFIPYEYIESVYWEGKTSPLHGAPSTLGNILQLNLYDDITLVFKVIAPDKWGEIINRLKRDFKTMMGK